MQQIKKNFHCLFLATTTFIFNFKNYVKGSNVAKSQSKRGVANAAPSIAEESDKNGDEGILKSLKDLEWDMSEILAEKVSLLII